jgi:hypothetical protein
MVNLNHKAKRNKKKQEVLTMAKVMEINKVAPVVEDGNRNFWADKMSCWEKSHCPEMIKTECPAVKFQFLACWEIEGTYCKLDDKGATGRDTSVCETCQVYKKYGNDEPIRIKLFGRGIDTHLREMEKVA